MDTNVHETLLLSSTIPELRIKEMDSISNSIQDFDEEKRFRKLVNRRSDDNENQSTTCFRETRSNNRWSSQFHNEGRYSGWPMRSNHSDVSNERWSRGTNRWGNSNHPSRCRDGYVPNTNWSGENFRWDTYGSYRAFNSSWTDRYNRQGRHRYNRQGRHRYNRQERHRYNRQGRNGSYRVEDTTWLNEGYRNGRYVGNVTWSNDWHRQQVNGRYVGNVTWSNDWHRQQVNGRYVSNVTWSNDCHRQQINGRYVSNVTWSNDWHRQQINGSYRTEDPTQHESYENYRAEYMSCHYERNRQGRYGSGNVEYMTCLDAQRRQGRYGSLGVHRPGWANAHYRQVRTSSNRGQNMSLSIESYRGHRYWNHTYPTRRRDSSYNERCIAVPLLKDKENVESAATVSLPLAKTSNLALNLHEHSNVESQVSSRHPVSGEAASKGIYVVQPISNGIVHSDLTTKDDTSSKKIGRGSCNIEGKSELEPEVSSELRNSDCKTISSFLKVEVAVMDERFENEQGQALETCVSQSVEDNNVSLLGICCKNNPCAALEADTYSCMADKPFDVLHPFPERPLTINSRKKLLILDINGLLADIISPPPKECKPDICILRRAIFKRPFCYDFLTFCFERFHVGIWSSRTKKIIDRVVDYLLGCLKRKLVLCWDLSHCTPTKFKSLENMHKAVVFKELKKIWEHDDPRLNWKEGDYNASNTLLIDDSPYKALLNPMHSAIFPKSYTFKDTDDNSLGPEGDLRVYLENLAAADDIQKYVEQQPLGQKAIDETDCNWSFYSEVVSSVVASTTNECESSSCMPSNTTEGNLD